MEQDIGDEIVAARAPARNANNSERPESVVLPDAPHGANVDAADALTPISRDVQAGTVPVEVSKPSVRTEDAVQRRNDTDPEAANSDKPAAWQAPTEQVIEDVATTPVSFAMAPPSGPNGHPKTGQRAGFAVNGTANGDHGVAVKTEDSTPRSTRGRPRGRPRGKARGTGRGGKRKRDDDDEDEADSDSSVEVTPNATMTKSGRSVQKPTSFAPPPQSPTANPKRKRPFNRRNPESAVCKICLRGTSPASNMIVFCDGCNAPYHRWCHKPPIDPTVVEEVDKEWFCKQCESERVIPVPQSEVASFISAEGASAEQRQKYFSSLPSGLLVSLLVKATTLHPTLPLFDPEFKPVKQSTSQVLEDPSSTTVSKNGSDTTATVSTSHLPPGQAHFALSKRPLAGENETIGANVDPDEKYTEEVHPANYPRPGQGLMSTLPPEQNDLHYLVDDDDKYGVFTHVYHKEHPKKEANAVAGAEMNNG